MKKSKFLLLGSVASLASIPFVAAKCGETKEEKKPEEGKNPGQNTEPGKNPGENTEPRQKSKWKHRARQKSRRKHRTRQKSRRKHRALAKIQVKKWTLETIWHQAQILKMATIKIHLSRNLYPLLLAIVTNN